jgi:hypothetical protein
MEVFFSNRDESAQFRCITVFVRLHKFSTKLVSVTFSFTFHSFSYVSLEIKSICGTHTCD